jgi:predicted TIM-barrel fold metal-dependent hydrolase
MRDIHDPTTVEPIRYDGVVDADGHILEPPTLWTDYIDPPFRDRALCVMVNDDGLEYLEIDGAPSPSHAPGLLSELGRSNDSDLGGPPRPYLEGLPFGSMDPVERVVLLDHENITTALLYPSIGIMWEADTEDTGLIQAHCRAYNRWIADFCRGSGGRLVPIAHLSLSDPEAAAAELERAVADGCRGAFVGSWTHNRRGPGHPSNDPVWAVAQGLGVPIAIHPTVGSMAVRPNLYRGVLVRPYSPHIHMGRDHVRQSFTTFFDYATFDRFPTLTVVALESGAGWIGYTLDRLDEVHAMRGRNAELRNMPSDYFRRQCYISCDPAERTIGAMMDLYGADRFFWASDYPHPDHSIDYLRQMEILVEPLSPESRAAILGENVTRCYGL